MSDTETKRAPAPHPTEIRVHKDRASLTVTFDDGKAFLLPAEYLRVESPSAEVKGHGAGQAVTLGGKRHVKITGAEPVGNYAVRLIFDDGHDTGLYSWTLLHRLGRDRETIWQEYLERLQAQGKTRE